MYLKFLLNPIPPALLFTQDRGRSQVISVWMEDTAKVCMYLFLSLLCRNQRLLQTLGMGSNKNVNNNQFWSQAF